MKKTLLQSVALFCLTISLFSCKKNDIELPIPNNIKNHTKQVLRISYTVDSAANPNNPFDSVGYLHNIILQETRNTWIDSPGSASNNFNAVINYFNENNLSINLTFSEVMLMDSLINSDTSKNQLIFLNSLNYSSNFKTILGNIFTLTKIASNYDSYEDFKMDMIVIENGIVANNLLSESEKNSLLSSASVARHSVLYWARESAGLNSDSNTNSNPNGPIGKSIFKAIRQWLKDHPVATADIGGAIAGASGGWLGALFGAAGASIVEWATQSNP
jgi:hypothetical protein